MKFANITLNRKDGPVIKNTQGITEEEKNNILVFALPTGEAKNGAFKLVKLQDNFYVSYIELDENANGNAAVIGINVAEEKLDFNPFALFDHLKDMVRSGEVPDIDRSNIGTTKFTKPYSENFKGGEYIISSMFLLERLIVVGDHEEIISFLGTLYQAAPIQSIPYFMCVTLIDSISENINIQGVEMTEKILSELDDARRDSTIVILDENEAYGTKTSPFSKEVFELYLQGNFVETSKKVTNFLDLASGERIVSSAEFAAKHNIPKTDAILLKQLQTRLAEIREMRKNNIYYKGVN